jgi:hypothetical protein
VTGLEGYVWRAGGRAERIAGGRSLTYFAPFTSSGVVFWGLLAFFAIVVVTIVALIYMRVTGREEWMDKAQLVFEQSGSSH